MVLAGWIATRDAAASPGAEVVVLQRDLPLGSTLSASDLNAERRIAVPDGALTTVQAAVGQRLSSPVRRGEVLTDARLVDRQGAAPGPGRSAVAVRLADRAVSGLLQPGMSVALAGVDPAGALTKLTGDAVVLAVLTDGSDSGPPPVLFSVPAADVDRVTAATVGGEVAVQFI